jgi:hypothetical protein
MNQNRRTVAMTDVDPLIETASDISQELYGTPTKARRVRDLAKRGVIPAGHFGGVLAIRRSRLRECVDAIGRPLPKKPPDDMPRPQGRGG